MNRILLSRSLHILRPIPLISQTLRLFSSLSDPASNSQHELSSLLDTPPNSPILDISNSEFKRRLVLYLKGGDEQVLPSIMEAVLTRRASRDHDETDDEMIDGLRMKPLDDVKDQVFESDFEEMHETDEDLDNLYHARDYVLEKMMKDQFFNIDDKKWDEMIKEASYEGVRGGS